MRALADVDRAITDGATHGMVKLITNARGGILGGHILRRGAGNMITEITLAMKHRRREAVRDMVRPEVMLLMEVHREMMR